MKRLILAATLALVSTHAAAFGIGMCEYAKSERTGAIMAGVKMAYTMPEDVYESQLKYCQSADNMRRAAQVLSQEPEERIEQPVQAGNYDGAVQRFKRCIAVYGESRAASRMCENYVMGY